MSSSGSEDDRPLGYVAADSHAAMSVDEDEAPLVRQSLLSHNLLFILSAL